MILVTGATGFVGRSVMNTLLLANRPAVAYDGRIHDTLRLRAALRDANIVIHLASGERSGTVRALRQVDVEGTSRLIQACQATNVKYVVMLSRFGADRDSRYPLLQAKGQAEYLLRHSGLPHTIVRSASIYGSGDSFSTVIAALAYWSWPFVWYPGGGRVSFQPLCVEDVARCVGHVAMRQHLPDKTVTIAGEERYPYAELVSLFMEAAQIGRRIPLPVPWAAMRVARFGAFELRRHPPVSRFMLHRFSVPEVTALDTVMRHFSFRPRRMINELGYLRNRNVRWRLFTS